MARLSRHAILRRMHSEPPRHKGLKKHVYHLETESVFALENIRLGYFDIAREINMPAARKAHTAIIHRLARGETAPPRLNEALLAYERALYALKGE